MSLDSIVNSKLPKQPVPRAQIGNASPGGGKPLGAKSPIKVVAIAGPGNKKATPVTLQTAGAVFLWLEKFSHLDSHNLEPAF